MKKISISTAIVFFLIVCASAQTIERSTISSGSSFSNNQLHWVLGELATEKLVSSNGAYVLTQGFLQPEFTVAGNDQMVMQLKAGWNLVSSYIIPQNPDMLAIVSPIANNVILIKDYGGIHIASPSLQINTIGNWDVKKAYMIKVTSDMNLTITGTKVDPASTPIAITPGWQWIPYLNDYQSGIANELSSIQGLIILVKNLDGNLIYSVNPPINTIGNLKPGMGYKLKANGAGVLVY